MTRRSNLPPLPGQPGAVSLNGRPGFPACIRELSDDGKDAVNRMSKIYVDGIVDGVFELLRFFSLEAIEEIQRWHDAVTPDAEKENFRYLVAANVILSRWGPEYFKSSGEGKK